jgi:hypothetical protein
VIGPDQTADSGPWIRRSHWAHAGDVNGGLEHRRRAHAAPNVLVILIDDGGFGNPDTFGGPISTPAMTRVREMGLTYNRFHVTAVCSPTRGALLTGRNQRRAGFGSIAEYPARSRAIRPRSRAGAQHSPASSGTLIRQIPPVGSRTR